MIGEKCVSRIFQKHSRVSVSILDQWIPNDWPMEPLEGLS